MKDFKVDIEKKYKKIISELQEYFKNIGFENAIIGLSGGIDSALVAYLLRDALGHDKVRAIMMPYKTSSENSLRHAKIVVEDTKIKSEVIEITDMIDAYFKNDKDASSLRKGNKMARERMSILYDNSSKYNAIVVGTSNKSEIYLGYSTQFGDSASAINPIGDLYKSEVWEMSKFLNINDEIISKKPSADLWEGQTDESELGLTYAEADQILYQLLEENKTREELISMNFDANKIDKVLNRMKKSEYKRHMPLIIKVQ